MTSSGNGFSFNFSFQQSMATDTVSTNIDLPMDTIRYQLTYLFLGRWSTLRAPPTISEQRLPSHYGDLVSRLPFASSPFRSGFQYTHNLVHALYLDTRHRYLKIYHLGKSVFQKFRRYIGIRMKPGPFKRTPKSIPERAPKASK